MYWRVPNNSYLIRGTATARLMCSDRGRINLPDGTRADAATDYIQLSVPSEVEAHYRAPWTTAYEDDVYVLDIHVVIESTFRRYTYCEGRWHEPVLDEQVILQGLELVTLEAVPFNQRYIRWAFEERSSPP
jgi:hypothetical protein